MRRPLSPPVLLAACSVLWAAGCGPEPGPARVAVLAFAADSGEYQLAPATLHTVRDVTRLEGDAAVVKGGAYVHIDPNELAIAEMQGRLNSIEDVRRVLVKDEGSAANLGFTSGVVQGEEVLVPDDFHALAMVTTYHHLERARLVGLELGMPETCLRDMTTWYDLKLVEATYSPEPQSDNAAFSAILQAFMVLPFDLFKRIPMAMNPGIMGHEYGHGVWSCYIDDGQPLSVVGTLDPPAQRYAAALNEGLADYFGALVAGRPDYIGGSIPSIASSRDLSAKRVFTADMRDDAESEGGYDPYALGAVLASSLWAVHLHDDGGDRVGRIGLRSLTHLRARFEAAAGGLGAFSLAGYLADLVRATGEIAPDLQQPMCTALGERFALAGPVAGC